MNGAERLKVLAERYRSWEDEALVRAVTLEATDYEEGPLALLRAEIERRGLSLEEARETLVPEQVRRERALVGVRGWLALLVLVIAAHGLRLVCVSVLCFLGPLILRNLILGLLQGVVGVFGLFAAWQLLRRSPEAPRLATTWLVTNTAINLGFVLLSVAHGSGLDAGGIFGGLAWAAFWSTYLACSKRVKATYDPAANDQELVTTFS